MDKKGRGEEASTSAFADAGAARWAVPSGRSLLGCHAEVSSRVFIIQTQLHLHSEYWRSINQLPALSVQGSVRCSATNWRPGFADTWGRHCRGRNGLGCCTGTAPGLWKIRTTWAILHVVFIMVCVPLVSSNKRQAPNAESGPSTDPCTEFF